jgi:hypothetical protein
VPIRPARAERETATITSPIPRGPANICWSSIMDDYSLMPVDHQPDFGDFSLVPVEHDPFSGDGVAPPVQTQPQTQFQPAQTQPQTQSVPQTQPQQPAAGTSDFFQSIPRGIVSGFNSAASALGRATQAEMGQEVDAPTAEQGLEILEKEVTGPMHRPEGRAGKFGASVGEFLGNPASYLAPGSLPFKVGTAVLGGLGSEAGGQLGEGTPLELPFRFAGGALGPSVLGAARLGARARAAETLAPAAEDAGALGGKVLPADSAGSVADKLDRYLLNPDNTRGGPKAEWFKQALGFTRENSADLAKQLIFDESQAVRNGVNEYGTLFRQTINVTGVNGRTIPVATGWIVGADGVPRLTTAFPSR